MIIVLGSVEIKEGSLAEALQISQTHVARSRLEPGCIEHGVHQDYENRNRLVFVERWETMASLQAHFAVPESNAMVRALAALATKPPSMALYNAEELQIPGKRST